MADKKISQLTGATTPLAGTEVLPIVQSGSTVKVSAADVTAGRAVSAASVAVTGSSAPANGVYLPAANTVGVATNSATNFRIDSSGRALLGVSSVLSYGGDSTTVRSQTVVSDASTNTVRPVAAFVRQSSGTPANGIGAQIYLTTDNAYTSVSDYAALGCVATDIIGITGDLSISTRLNNTMTEQVRVTSAGNVKMINAGKGIDFSANTGAAGMTSELLNWYEEGTWTPTITGSTSAGTGTYSTQIGRYTRVGNIVHCQAYIVWSAHTGTGNLWLTGLPFTMLAVTDTHSSGSIGLFSNVALTAGNVAIIYGSPNTTRVNLAQYPTGGGAQSPVPIDTAGEIGYSIVYTV